MAADTTETASGDRARAPAIQLEIVTPKGRALLANADEVTAPSVQGEFGVLPGHLPLLAALRTGLVTYRQGGETKRCAVGAGFAEAGPDKVVILTDEYAARDDVDPVVVRKDLAEVQEQLQKLEGVPVVAREAKGGEAAERDARARREVLIARENWLAAQLELYGDPPAATQRPYEEFGPPAPPAEDELPGGQEPQASTGSSDRAGGSDGSRRDK
jgi:F-type H+-transporting ATPase subunit epsilon